MTQDTRHKTKDKRNQFDFPHMSYVLCPMSIKSEILA